MSKHRYGYAVNIVASETAFDTAGLLKHDLRSGHHGSTSSPTAGSGRVRLRAVGGRPGGRRLPHGLRLRPDPRSSDFVVLDASTWPWTDR